MAAACAFYRLEKRFSGDALEKVEAVLLPDSFLLFSSGNSLSVLNGLMPEPPPMLFLARICLQLAALLDADCLAVMKIESFVAFLALVPLTAACFFELEEFALCTPPTRICCRD